MIPLAIAAVILLLLLFRERQGRRRQEAAARRAEQRCQELDAAATALERRAGLLEGLFAQAPIGIAVLDGGQRYAEANPALCRMLGFTADELKAIPYGEMCHPLDLRSELEASVALLQGRSAVARYRRRYTAKDGREIWAEVSSVLCRDAQGGDPAMLRFIVEGAAQAEDGELDRLRECLARSRRDLESFASIASHDIQESMRMVSTHLSLIGERSADQLDGRTRHWLAVASEAAGRMRRQMKDLVEYARLDSSDPPRAPCALDGLLAAASGAIAAEMGAASCRLECGALPSLPVHAEQITKLFQQLLSNALKFRGEKDPWVRISAQPCAEGWLFVVADNGIGVPPERCAEVFGIFRRLHGRERYPGNGIGLALCRKIIEGHGGRIWMESAPGEGTRVNFVLPAGAEAAQGAS